MAITIRGVTTATNTGSSPTISAVTPATGPTSALVGDLLLILHGNDFYALSNMTTPTLLPSATVTGVPNGTADGGANEGHLKAYTSVVGTAGAQTVTEVETGTADEEKCLAVYILGGVDTTTPIDIAAGFNGTPGNDNQTCPSIITTLTDDLLVCVNNSGPSSTAAYGSPSSPFVEQYEIHVGGMSGVGGTEQLAASGATGTRTFTTVAGAGIVWVSLSIAIRTAGSVGGGIVTPKQALVVPSPAVQSWSW